MTPGQRALRLIRLFLRHPICVFAGLVALPSLNLMIKLRWVNARKLGLILAPAHFNEKPFSDDTATGMSQAINIGAKFWHLQDTSCIARSVLLWLLYRWRGIPALVIVGDDLNSQGSFHTWVEINDWVVSEFRSQTDQMKRFDAPYLP